jgi:ABC-type polysaccharide/polyol phosphate export permease
VSVWGALAGGFVGTLVLSTALSAGSQLRLTRMDIPFLLGTACTDDRTRAKVFGYALHFLAGLAFALAYYAVFVVLGRAGWLLGLGLGFVHALFAGTTLVNVLLPAVHPRMGTPSSAADSSPLLEPPGFMLLNYGHATPLLTLLAHLAYGAIVGAFVAGAAR